MAKTNAEYQADYRRRQKELINELESRLATVPHGGERNVTELEQRLSDAKAMIEKLLRKTKALEAEKAELQAEIEHLQSVEIHEPMGSDYDPNAWG